METPASYARHHKYIIGILIIAVLIAAAVGIRMIGRKAAITEIKTETKVTLISASDYLKDRSEIRANGVVESLQQAELRSQAAGQVTKIHVSIGQKVSEGQALVSLQQADIAAVLAQAQALLKSQQARLDEMMKGARVEQVQIVEGGLAAAKQALVDTKNTQDAVVKSAYAALLNNGLAIVPNSNNISHARISLGGSYTLTAQGIYTITMQGGEKSPFSVSGIETATGWVTRGASVAVGTGGLYITASTDGDIVPGDSWTITIPNTQSPMYSASKNTYDTALKARDAAINGATNALTAAQNQYDLVMAGATSDQIKAQQAAVEQAAANVSSATAQFEKTVIRSPINGVVASLPIKYGELVSPGTLAASVVSKNALQVKTYLSDYDIQYVREGAEVAINDTVKGKVSHISPSVDSMTKTVEALVVINNAQTSGLVVGQNATLKIAVVRDASKALVYLLPLQAVKIANAGASVFTVKADSTLEEHAVTLGNTSGEYVEVTQGISPDMKIVAAVYELRAGQTVTPEQ